MNRAPSRDRFGNEVMLIGLKDKKGTGFGKGFIEIGGKLLKVEYSPANKEGYTGWVKLTKVQKRSQASRW